MVKVETYVGKDGSDKNRIKFNGMGDEEVIKLTLKADKVFEGTPTKTKFGLFVPRGIGAVYHKDGKDIDCWVGLTEREAKMLDKMGIQNGLNIEVYRELNPNTKRMNVFFRDMGMSAVKKVVFGQKKTQTELVVEDSSKTTVEEDNLIKQFKMQNQDGSLTKEQWLEGCTNENISLKRAEELYKLI
jgi:hypothetical protein